MRDFGSGGGPGGPQLEDGEERGRGKKKVRKRNIWGYGMELLDRENSKWRGNI